LCTSSQLCDNIAYSLTSLTPPHLGKGEYGVPSEAGGTASQNAAVGKRVITHL